MSCLQWASVDIVQVCIHATMKCTLRNKHSENEVWIINLALILYVATTTISKHSSVTASDDASLLWYLQNDTAVTYFGNETSAETTYISSSSTQTANPSESPDNGSSLPLVVLVSMFISKLTNSTTESTTTTLEPSTYSPLTTSGTPWLIIGLVVGGCLLLILLAVFFVYRKPLLGYCNIGGQNGVRQPSFAPYVPQDQETSVPENSGTSATLSSFNYQIRGEFKELASYNPAIIITTAHLEENVHQNRHRDVVPYDFNIVRLKSGNYVNASHVESNIIMTQDPIMTQLDEFWQMVWEHNVSIIVRLSNDHDDRTLPSAVYIPPHRWVVGQLEVTNVADPRQRTHFSRRIIRLNEANATVRNRVREIYHYHLDCWETDTLPPVKDFMVALQDIRKQKKIFDQMGFTRTLIHCGSGSGRTGAFVTLWLLLDSLDAEETDISVFKTVRRLREQRAHVVNKLELYKFVYKCVEFYKTNVVIPRSESPYETVVGVGHSGSIGTASRSASPMAT